MTIAKFDRPSQKNGRDLVVEGGRTSKRPKKSCLSEVKQGGKGPAKPRQKQKGGAGDDTNRLVGGEDDGLDSTIATKKNTDGDDTLYEVWHRNKEVYEDRKVGQQHDHIRKTVQKKKKAKLKKVQKAKR